MNIVSAVILKDSLVLIGKLYNSKITDFGGIRYIFPGGQVEEGEEQIDAIKREVKEETNLDVIEARFITSRQHPITQNTISYFHCTTEKLDTSTISKKNDDIETLIWVEKTAILSYMPTIYKPVLDFISKEI